jgi:hypothetical protein
MKLRMILRAVLVTLALWVPAIAQQPAAPAPSSTTGAAKSGCSCCDPAKDHGQDAKGDSAPQGCCQSKNSDSTKSMPCCTQEEVADGKKDDNKKKAAMACCTGKNGKMCTMKDQKECCGKDAMACNEKEGRTCCAGQGQTCSRPPSKS